MRSYWILLSFCLLFSSVLSKKCPGKTNQCSLHGECMINHDGEYVCNCQWGWTEIDCSKKLCPHGFDPTSGSKLNKKLRMQVRAADGKIEGKLFITFHGSTIEVNANAKELNTDNCAHQFRRFQNFEKLECKRVSMDTNQGGIYEITLISFPIHPIMNNLYYHNGNVKASDFSCDTSKTTGATQVECIIESITDDNVKEYLPCSNHGICNENTGECLCNNGFYGVNCDNNKDDKDILIGVADGPFYSGSIGKLKSIRGKSSDFNLLTAESGHDKIFTISGSGETTLHEGKLKVLKGGQIIEKGGLEVVNDGIVIHNSNLLIKEGKSRIISGSDGTVLDIISTTEDVSEPIIKINSYGNSRSENSWNFLELSSSEVLLPLFSINGSGTTTIQKGGLRVVSGGIEVESNGIKIQSGGEIIEKGGLHVSEGGVIVGSGGFRIENGGIIVNDGGAAIKSTSTSEPSLSVIPLSENFQSTILKLDSSMVDLEGGYYFLKAQSQSGYVFDIDCTGRTTIHSGGLTVASGGIRVESGGQEILSGGLHIAGGGIKVSSGGFKIENEGFEISDGGLKVSNSMDYQPTLSVIANHPRYASSAVSIQVGEATNVDEYLLIEARDSRNSSLFRVSGDGSIFCNGDIHTGLNGSLVSHGPLIIEERAILRFTRLSGNESLSIPCTHSYVQIVDDGMPTEMNGFIETNNAISGQMLYVQNKDGDRILLKGIYIPPMSTVGFVFDGQNWNTLTAISFDASIIRNVKEFSIDTNLDVGEYTISAREIQAGNQQPNHVSYYGKGGLLRGDEKFTYTNELLEVPAIKVKEILGRVDLRSSEFVNVNILGGSLNNVNLTANLIHGTGLMYVESSAFIGGPLTVNGPVSGSGAYVDSSDLRYKKNISIIEHSLDRLRNLRGVSYLLRTDEFPKNNFESGRQIGFIAQEVEKHIPEVVQEDSKGYKSIAYGRLVPVVVEGIKELNMELESCNLHIKSNSNKLRRAEERIEKLENSVSDLKEELRKISKMYYTMIKTMESNENNWKI